MQIYMTEFVKDPKLFYEWIFILLHDDHISIDSRHTMSQGIHPFEFHPFTLDHSLQIVAVLFKRPEDDLCRFQYLTVSVFRAQYEFSL